MSPSPSPRFRVDGSCLAASDAPGDVPTFNDVQGRFLEGLSIRSHRLSWGRRLWAIHKPSALRSKTIDFAQVQARYERWDAQGRPRSGKVAEQFEHAARKFQRALDDAPQSAKRMKNHE